jgi:hypothetical protein
MTTTLYSQTTGEYIAEVSDLSARLIMDRCPDKFFIYEEAEEVTLDDLSYLGISIDVGGTD